MSEGRSEHDAAAYATMAAAVRAELQAAADWTSDPALDAAVERVVLVVGRFVLAWVED